MALFDPAFFVFLLLAQEPATAECHIAIVRKLVLQASSDSRRTAIYCDLKLSAGSGIHEVHYALRAPFYFRRLNLVLCFGLATVSD